MDTHTHLRGTHETTCSGIRHWHDWQPDWLSCRLQFGLHPHHVKGSSYPAAPCCGYCNKQRPCLKSTDRISAIAVLYLTKSTLLSFSCTYNSHTVYMLLSFAPPRHFIMIRTDTANRDVRLDCLWQPGYSFRYRLRECLCALCGW